jgi:hypothetical protein
MTLDRTPRAAAALAVLLIGAAHDAAAQPAPQTRIIKCEGPFAAKAGRDDLVKAFGAANVVDQDANGAEGEVLKATVLFPNDPKARIEVLWNDEEARRGPTLRLRDQATWSTTGGVRLRASLTDIEKRNGKPFKLSGFGWDYGGQVLNWEKGALDKPQGGCHVSISFSYPDNAPQSIVAKVLGDKEFASTNPNMRAVKPYVSDLIVTNPER